MGSKAIHTVFRNSSRFRDNEGRILRIWHSHKKILKVSRSPQSSEVKKQIPVRDLSKKGATAKDLDAYLVDKKYRASDDELRQRLHTAAPPKHSYEVIQYSRLERPEDTAATASFLVAPLFSALTAWAKTLSSGVQEAAAGWQQRAARAGQAVAALTATAQNFATSVPSRLPRRLRLKLSKPAPVSYSAFYGAAVGRFRNMNKGAQLAVPMFIFAGVLALALFRPIGGPGTGNVTSDSDRGGNNGSGAISTENPTEEKKKTDTTKSKPNPSNTAANEIAPTESINQPQQRPSQTATGSGTIAPAPIGGRGGGTSQPSGSTGTTSGGGFIAPQPAPTVSPPPVPEPIPTVEPPAISEPAPVITEPATPFLDSTTDSIQGEVETLEHTVNQTPSVTDSGLLSP